MARWCRGRGYIGEVGWPAGRDATAWNRLAAAWYRAAAADLEVSYWATGEWWGQRYPLSAYVASRPGAGPLDTLRPQAAIVEQQDSAELRGVTVNGGEFGENVPETSPDSTFSNARTFGWEMQPFAAPDYLVAPHGDQVGIDTWLMPSRDGQPRAIPVIRVADLDAAVAQVTDHNGTTPRRSAWMDEGRSSTHRSGANSRVSTQLIRNYEHAGILPPVPRTSTGYRRIDARHRQALLTYRALARGYGSDAASDTAQAIMPAVYVLRRS